MIEMGCGQIMRMLGHLGTYLKHLGCSTACTDGSIKREDHKAAIKGFNDGLNISNVQMCVQMTDREALLPDDEDAGPSGHRRRAAEPQQPRCMFLFSIPSWWPQLDLGVML